MEIIIGIANIFQIYPLSEVPERSQCFENCFYFDPFFRFQVYVLTSYFHKPEILMSPIFFSKSNNF
jgi:hypothetical protein